MNSKAVSFSSLSLY